jgi:hypothetical protein
MNEPPASVAGGSRLRGEMIEVGSASADASCVGLRDRLGKVEDTETVRGALHVAETSSITKKRHPCGLT